MYKKPKCSVCGNSSGSQFGIPKNRNRYVLFVLIGKPLIENMNFN